MSHSYFTHFCFPRSILLSNPIDSVWFSFQRGSETAAQQQNITARQARSTFGPQDIIFNSYHFCLYRYSTFKESNYLGQLLIFQAPVLSILCCWAFSFCHVFVKQQKTWFNLEAAYVWVHSVFITSLPGVDWLICCLYRCVWFLVDDLIRTWQQSVVQNHLHS